MKRGRVAGCGDKSPVVGEGKREKEGGWDGGKECTGFTQL